MTQTKNIVSTLLILNTLTFAGGNIAPVAEIVHDEVTESTSYFQNLYLGIGLSKLKLDNSTLNESFESTAIMLQVGYKLHEYLSIEGQYSRSIGNISYESDLLNIDDYPSDFSNIALYLKPHYCYENISAYLLLGYGEVELTNIPQGDVDRAEDSFQWGIGLAYDINKDFSLFVDYINLYDDKGFDYRAVDSNIKVDTITLGVSYKF